MKSFKKMIALVLVLCLTLSLGITAFAEDDDELLYVCFGDSKAWGRIDEEYGVPAGYSFDNDSYRGLFAAYLGAKQVSYARRGMQVTDALYMIDADFKADVDNGVIIADSWIPSEYPPFDGTPLTEISANIAAADYISIDLGACDYATYPGALFQDAMAQVPDSTELEDTLKVYLVNGQIDEETYNAFEEMIDIYGEKALICLQFVVDMIDGFEDVKEYYPRLVKDIRDANEDATILLLGTFIPTGSYDILTETDDSGIVRFFLNRIVDKLNITVKATAIDYDCVYVDVSGVDCYWHPTPTGHQQICDRMVSVLNGDPTYAGDVSFQTAFIDKFRQDKEVSIEYAIKEAEEALEDKAFELSIKYGSRFAVLLAEKFIEQLPLDEETEAELNGLMPSAPEVNQVVRVVLNFFGVNSYKESNTLLAIMNDLEMIVTGDPNLLHVHTPKLVRSKEATATTAGSRAYYYCEECGKMFSDYACTNEITEADIVIPATGSNSGSASGRLPIISKSGSSFSFTDLRDVLSNVVTFGRLSLANKMNTADEGSSAGAGLLIKPILLVSRFSLFNRLFDR